LQKYHYFAKKKIKNKKTTKNLTFHQKQVNELHNKQLQLKTRSCPTTQAQNLFSSNSLPAFISAKALFIEFPL
jgi:hypothetical protein